MIRAETKLRMFWLIFGLLVVLILVVQPLAFAGRRSLVVAPLSGVAGATVGSVALITIGTARLHYLWHSVSGWFHRHRRVRAVLPWLLFYLLLGEIPELFVAALSWFVAGAIAVYASVIRRRR